MPRRIAVAVLSLLAACALAAPARAGAAPARTIGYSIDRVAVPGADMDEFARVVDATLNHARGWALGGRMRFARVSGTGGAFVVTLAAPAVVARYPGCSAAYSCRSGRRVLINSARWAGATPTYPGAALRHAYRQMVVNHEVGHALGFGHAACTRSGGLAPVMQQQSKSLDGCRRNPWPLASERRAFGTSRGVTPGPIAAPLALGRRAGYVTLGATRDRVNALLGPPQGTSQDGTGRTDTYTRDRLVVRFTVDRVVAVTTRAAADVTAGGVGIGTARATLERRVAVQCAGAECTTADGRTTFALRDDRVVAVTVTVTPTGTPALR